MSVRTGHAAVASSRAPHVCLSVCVCLCKSLCLYRVMSSSISEFYRGRSVLVTGASGFIGKQLVEKLLRSCPDIDKIYLLLRGTRFHNPPERLQYILSSPVCSSCASSSSSSSSSSRRLDVRIHA